MLSENEMSLVADSVHRAVQHYYEFPEEQSLAYAVVGAELLSSHTGELYTATGGCLQFETHPGDEDGPFVFAIESDDPASPDEYHFWITRLRSEEGDEMQANAVIDLCARHYKDMAKSIQIPWERGNFPDTLWVEDDSDVFEKVYEKHGVDLDFNPGLLERLDSILAKEPEDLKQVADFARRLFQESLEENSDS